MCMYAHAHVHTGVGLFIHVLEWLLLKFWGLNVLSGRYYEREHVL